MKLFLDTANIAHIKQWISTGLIDGVTTNPTLLSASGNDPKKIIGDICSLLNGRPVSVEVTCQEPDMVYKQAHELAKIADNVVVKIPCDKKYFEIINKLVSDGVPLNITLIFTLIQGLAMCKLNVSYISPFLGRLDDIDSSGAKLVQELVHMVTMYEFRTQVLAASLRTVSQLHDVIMAGAHCATIPFSLMEKAFEHPLTKIGMDAFLSDWQKTGVKIFP